ncbi:uncharacterized protein LOC127287082 [Leptopilina boulardi]|uniref:uncharacterized protein LOC127287082 n=1 Tax=Leptopilina boulardi TaxID=63433 RepID=UPI0021F50971|nr:uncharacterized protein LOC127287082 [Leptopilina boulardi]XP_051169773.1 uncharacterized protein LOC127287082 [Leptopilina boulardi]
MRLVQLLLIFTFTLSINLVLVHSQASKITFQDETSEESSSARDEVPRFENQSSEGRQLLNRSRQGKDLFDWIGLGTGRHVDSYLARTNEACLNGDFAECFKSRALNTFSDFFDQPEYTLSESVKIIRMPRDVVKSVNQQPYEYASAPRSEDSEWDQLVKFAMRKAEKFVKTVAFKVDIPSWAVGENEVYAPRFIDEIADEIDTIENKKDTLFSRNRLKRILIPMLIVLKLFKLKLLLFLPLILGLASFKKFLGFMAIVIPGIIGVLRLCRPLTQSYQPPVYSYGGVGFPHYKENHAQQSAYDQGSYSSNYHENHGDTVSFGQDLAYQGYRDYQS